MQDSLAYQISVMYLYVSHQELTFYCLFMIVYSYWPRIRTCLNPHTWYCSLYFTTTLVYLQATVWVHQMCDPQLIHYFMRFFENWDFFLNMVLHKYSFFFAKIWIFEVFFFFIKLLTLWNTMQPNKIFYVTKNNFNYFLGKY